VIEHRATLILGHKTLLAPQQMSLAIN